MEKKKKSRRKQEDAENMLVALWAIVKEGSVSKLKPYLRDSKRSSRIKPRDWVNHIIPTCPYGETLLHYAAYHGHEDVAALLIRAGANVDARGTKSGATPLHSAAAGGHLGMVAFLVACGADPHAKSSTDWTPLHCCGSRGLEQIYWFLMNKCGCDEKARNDNGVTPKEMLALRLLKDQQPEEVTPEEPVVVPMDPGSPEFGTPSAVTLDPAGILNPDGSLSIQIASDIHLEFYQDNEELPEFLVPSAPVLALLGDIGNPLLPNYAEFLCRQADRYKLVLVLAGNHEYYSPYLHHPKENPSTAQPTYAVMNNAIRTVCNLDERLIFMDRTTVNVGPYCLLGSTLWSAVPDSKKDYVQNSMNDYNFIFAEPEGKRITVHTTTTWHGEEVEWMKKEVEASMARQQKCVILTHHTPSFQSRGSGFGFSSHLHHFFRHYGKKDNSNVLAWLYGHTHFSDSQNIHGTRVVSNQCGYRTEESRKYYKADYVVTVA